MTSVLAGAPIPGLTLSLDSQSTLWGVRVTVDWSASWWPFPSIPSATDCSIEHWLRDIPSAGTSKYHFLLYALFARTFINYFQRSVLRPDNTLWLLMCAHQHPLRSFISHPQTHILAAPVHVLYAMEPLNWINETKQKIFLWIRVSSFFLYLFRFHFRFILGHDGGGGRRSTRIRVL